MLSAAGFECCLGLGLLYCTVFCWLFVDSPELFLCYAKLMANYMIITCLFGSIALLFLHISNVYRNFAAIKD